MQRPQRLTPSLRERVWGRTRLAPWFPDSGAAIGEAWYLSDRALPLLVKMLFTSDRLSVQVHPDDGEDGARGKTEMWHIIDAEPGASIALGFREPITRERLLDSSKTGEIVRGAPARVAHLDPTPCPVPPDWSRQGYGSIFIAQGGEVGLLGLFDTIEPQYWKGVWKSLGFRARVELFRSQFVDSWRKGDCWRPTAVPTRWL